MSADGCKKWERANSKYLYNYIAALSIQTSEGRKDDTHITA
jgi:hypothetical protein